MSELHLVVYEFLVITFLSSDSATNCVLRVVSVHYDTGEYIQHIIFVCQILVN